MISYIITTKNKLPYLKIAIADLIDSKKNGDEILVADGGSTDGSRGFLEDLLKAEKIHYLISEKDFGESHALNKLFLKAKGDLISIITDDDAFHYPAIEACARFMENHSEIDMLGTDGGKRKQGPNEQATRLAYVEDYKKWQKDHRPFAFCGLGIMIRTSSLPLLGLWNPNFFRADAEFTLRVTSGKSNIAWYENPSFVNISNPQSVSLTRMKKIYSETQKLKQMYLGGMFVYPLWFIELRSKMSKIIKRKPENAPAAEAWEKTFMSTKEWLAEENRNDGKFLFNQ